MSIRETGLPSDLHSMVRSWKVKLEPNKQSTNFSISFISPRTYKNTHSVNQTRHIQPPNQPFSVKGWQMLHKDSAWGPHFEKLVWMLQLMHSRFYSVCLVSTLSKCNQSESGVIKVFLWEQPPSQLNKLGSTNIDFMPLHQGYFQNVFDPSVTLMKRWGFSSYLLYVNITLEFNYY